MALSVVTFHHVTLTACAGPVNVATDTKVTWLVERSRTLKPLSLVFNFSREEISPQGFDASIMATI